MGWAQSASGTTDEVREQVEGWAAKVESIDRQSGESNDVVALHQEHLSRCLEVVTPFLASTKAGYHVAVSIGGEAIVADPEGDGNLVVRREEWFVNLGTSTGRS